ncbi:MAG: DNA polymerase IV [Elusimicrobia bacterium]|nr:DNA polymerase IV [Elusimicrobiota bacterium]
MHKYIIHLDMDAFFASVEQKHNSAYAGKPVVVGADPKAGRGRGVVSACSYEARKFGISSAMPISIAYRRCPQAVFLPVNMELYSRESREIFSVFKDFTPEVEKLSIDEAFLDITGSFHLFKTPENTARKLKEKIKFKTGLTSSVGLAPNKSIAKIASDIRKPDGFVVVKESQIRQFLNPLGVDKLWGAGKKTVEKLNSMGIYKIGDLAARDHKEIADSFGKNGERLWKLSRGIDKRNIRTENDVKSVSNEYTFFENISGHLSGNISEDKADKNLLKSVLLKLSDKVSRRLRTADLKGRTVSLKIRLAGFESFTRSRTLIESVNYTEDIFNTVSDLYAIFNKKDNKENKKVRLVGVKVSNFKEEKIADRQPQFNLFEIKKDDKKKEKIYKAIDEIRKKHGAGIIYPAGADFKNTKERKREDV